MGRAMISAAGRRLINLMVGKRPQTVTELIESTGVTRTAVTEQLNELVAAGFVHRGTERLPGRGRPRHVYSTTDAALLLLFSDKEQRVVPAIWSAVGELGGRELLDKVIKKVSRDLADQYRQHITAKTPKERFKQLAKILSREGTLLETRDRNGRVVLRKRSCSFFHLFEENRSICCVDAEMMSDVVGHPVRQTESRHDGSPCCVFELVEEKGKKQ